jgi:hypothetical protein
MKTEAEITTLLLASAALGRERGDTTALEQALAEALKSEQARAESFRKDRDEADEAIIEMATVSTEVLADNAALLEELRQLLDASAQWFHGLDHLAAVESGATTYRGVVYIDHPGAALLAELNKSRAAINLAIHKIEQTIAGQYPEGQALQSALEVLKEASSG